MQIEGMRILLVEDSVKLANWLSKSLHKSGYAVDSVHDGGIADSMLASPEYDAVILDLGLPTIDGLTILKRLRDRGSVIPVLILSARGQLGDRISGLNLGADDYLPKPFDLSELDARLHALIRRAHGTPAPTLRLGALEYDTSDRVFRLANETLHLRPKEHAVLEALLLRVGKAISKAQLYEKVFSIDASTSADVVEIYIHRLRKHLQDSGLSIVTLRGLGYVLEAR
jgi:two-component system response regulator TctD